MRFFRRIAASWSLGLRFLKVTGQVIYGAWKITQLPQPIVSIFGGHLLKKDTIYINEAHQLASMLVENNISVLTGGGPGIMEAASSGAAHEHDKQIRSMAIGVKGIKGEKVLNTYVRTAVVLDYFFARKYLLIKYSYAFVLFPGGFGTLDELSELLNLIEAGTRVPAPIILIGSEYWHVYLTWIDRMLKEHLITPDGARQSLIVTDSIDEALKILIKHCATCTER